MTRRTAYASLPAHIRAAAERHPANRARVKRLNRAQRQPDGFDSKGEAEFAEWLKAERTVAESWRYHALVLVLPDGSRYTPDFTVHAGGLPAELERLVLRPCERAPFHLGLIECIEVMPRRKKHWRGLPSKGEQRVKIAWAASVYPWARFIRATPDADGWTFETVGAEARAS